MKDSKEYSRKVRDLYRSLKRKYPKVQKTTYDDPVESLVYAIVSENTSESATQSAIKRIADNFVDLNDLRVSLTEEIVEMLGADTSLTRDTALTLSRALGAVFGEYNTVSLEALKKIGKRPARQALEKIDGVSRFVIDYCMLTSLQAHAIPLTKKMIEYLRSDKMVHSMADEQQIEGFLARQISAENAYEFYVLLRRESESRKGRKKTKKEAAPKVKTKAAAKTKTKKKTKKVKRKK